MRFAAAILTLACGCELIEKAADRPGELKRAASVPPSREENILRAFFTEDFAQRKIAHLLASDLPDFDSVSQPRPRIGDVMARFGAAEEKYETDLSSFGVSSRAVVYRFGRLGLATPVFRDDGEIIWTLIAARPPRSP